MKPSKEFSSRIATAKKYRNTVQDQITEVMRFCSPGRTLGFNAQRHHESERQEGDTFHSLPEELATDLASDLVSYYTPSEDRWTNYIVTTDVPEDAADAVASMVNQRESELFDLIAHSNYYDVAPQWGFECATHGTPALWVTQPSIAVNIHCEVVPPDELLVAPGFMGHLDRFREQTIPAEYLEAQLAGYEVTFPDDIRRLMDKPENKVQLCYGFWVDWSDVGDPKWIMEISVNGKRVSGEKVPLGPLSGGVCPLLVGRFGPLPNQPWGRGAGLRALQDMRTLDTVEEIVLTHMDESLKRTIIYPDDGFIDLSQGIEAGRAYPAQRGFTRDQVYEFPAVGNLDYGYFTRGDLENRLRAMFFQDGPRQTGDTPPTATQWIDERRRVQQRLGKPSAPIWSEFVIPLIQRFEYLGVQSGAISEALSHNDQAILVSPISPLHKAQRNDQVMVSRANLELAFSTMQDQTINVVDMVGTFQNIVDASGDTLTKIHEQQKVPDAAQPPE